MHMPRYAVVVVALVALTVVMVGCGPRPQQEQPAPPAGPAPQAQAPSQPPDTPSPTQAATVTAAGDPAKDWPAFRGARGDGISTETGINKAWAQKEPRKLWEVSLSDNGHAGPSVAAGRVYIIDHDGDKDVVRALDLETGKDLWTSPYPDTASHNYGFARATPVFHDGMLYTLSRLGRLNCLEAASGEPVWTRDLVSEFGGKRPQWDYAASPLVDGDKLIVCPGGETGLAALDRKTGKTLWTGGAGGLAGYATPASATIGGVKQYVVFAGAELYGANASSGQVLWRTPWRTQYDVNAAMPIVAEDYVFVTSDYGVGCGMYRIASGKATLTWQSKDLQSHFNSPIYYKGFIYGIGDPGQLVCINPRDGKLAWKQDGFEKGGLALVDGALIAVNGKDGDVVMARAASDGYQELGRIKPLGGQSWTAPIIAQGRLLVRNTRALACLDLR